MGSKAHRALLAFPLLRFSLSEKEMAAQEAINIIQPREDWLKDDNNLVTLIKSVANFVQGDSLHERPTNTANMYLALCLGFQSAGVMQVDHAPNLWIDLGPQTFKVNVRSAQREPAVRADRMRNNKYV